MFTCSWIGYWLFRGIGIGRRIVSYWPKENKYIAVEVSSIKFRTFTARFEGKEPDCVDPWLYGQLDNDVEYDRRTRTPVDRPRPSGIPGR